MIRSALGPKRQQMASKGITSKSARPEFLRVRDTAAIAIADYNACGQAASIRGQVY
jgi:hypothetical protein